jgi:phosphate butyryltransferase
MELKKLNDLKKLLKKDQRKRLVVAAAQDRHVLEAVRDAEAMKVIQPVLIGDIEKIKLIAGEIDFDLKNALLLNHPDPLEASYVAVELINKGEGDILMKGLVGTAPILKAVLDKEKGLRKKALLSHVSLFESPYYHKLLGVTDVAMNIAPGLNEKKIIVENAVELFNAIGYTLPKVAAVAAVELVNDAMPATTDAALLTLMCKRKQILHCIIDGPLGFDNAISKEAATIKGIDSPVAGDADLLLCHDINAGNILYKSLNFLGGAECAALIMGAKVPFVLTSRADSEKSKLMSIVLASLI